MRGKLPIIILIIVLLVVYYLFGMDYMRQCREHETLTFQITDVTQALAQIPGPSQDLEQRLAIAQASLAAEQSAFTSNMSSSQIINNILKLAEVSEVKAIPLITKPWSTEEVGEHDYHVFRLNVAVKGSFLQLVSFVSKLENGEFKILIVEHLSVTSISEQPEEESISEGTISVIANLDLAIYTQSLPSD